MVAAVLTANVGPAVADEPAATPTPAPVTAPPAPDSDSTPAPDPAESPAPEPTPAPVPPEDGQINYITTVTTTTTTVNAPIIVVAAPITTTTNNTTAAGGTGANGALERFALSLTGCGRGGSPVASNDRVRSAHVRLAENATLIVRVNGRRVATLRLPPTAQRRPRGVALRLRLAPDGMLTIHRPSGRVLAIQGCTPA
jgi:hypothetical protein